MILILLKQAFTAIHAASEALVEKPPIEAFSPVLRSFGRVFPVGEIMVPIVEKRKSYGLATCVEK